jgi:hypothetical protein
LAIYTLTGENRFDRAEIGERFVLLNKETTTYAARILNDSLTKEEAINNFNIYTPSGLPALFKYAIRGRTTNEKSFDTGGRVQYTQLCIINLRRSGYELSSPKRASRR